MTKKTIIFIISPLLLIGLITTCLFTLPPLFLGEITIIDEFNNGTKLSGNGIMKVEGGWPGFSERNTTMKVILTKYDLFNPIYSIVLEPYEGTSYVQVVQLNRVSILDFEVEGYTGVAVYDAPFIDVVQLASKYNLAEQQPDGYDIHVERQEEINKRNSPPTQEEIQAEEVAYKKKAYDTMLFIKENWGNPDMDENLRIYGDIPKTFEEFRSKPNVIETFGTVEWLGI